MRLYHHSPAREKLRFSAKIDGFLRASYWTQAGYFCRSWTCVRESPEHRQKWSPRSTLTFSIERQTLQKHFWTWSIFEWPSPWRWLVLCATDVPYTDVYNTRPRLKFTAYSLGGPCAPSFCTRAPKCKKYGFVHRLTVFCELIVTHSRYRSIAHVRMYNTPSEVGGPVLGITALPASTPATQSVVISNRCGSWDIVANRRCTYICLVLA